MVGAIQNRRVHEKSKCVFVVSLIFKKCTIEDLDTLIELSRTTFIDAFEKANDPDDFKRYIQKAFNREQITSELMNKDSLFYFIVTETDGLVGYIKLNRKESQKEQFDLEAIELERIYIKKEFQGQRYGKEALLMVIDIARTHKASCLWLGVWEQNKRAIAFYQRHGFKKFGEHPYLIGEDEQYDWMMKLAL